MSAVRSPTSRLRLDGFDAAVLLAFAGLSLWVVAVDLWQVVAHGRLWTGTDGVYLADQLQYLAWIRDASRHVLVSNLFVLHPTPADYFQPAIAVSGGLTALGVAPWISLLMWKPIAVGGCFFAVRQFTRRSLPSRTGRRVALVLALFFGSFTIVYGSFGTIGDLFLGFLSWGYVFALLAVALLVAALLAYDTLRARNHVGWLPGILGALAGLLHPWHGALLIVIVLGAEAALRIGYRRETRRLALPAITVLLTALPLVYYVLLGRLDHSWHLAREASKHSFPLWPIALAVLPLLVPATLAYARRPKTFLPAATRAWPVAALIVYVLSASGLAATPLHAFEGITIPLAVLAVEGVRHLEWRRLPHGRLLVAAAIAAFTIPAAVSEAVNARRLALPRVGSAGFIDPAENRALGYLDDAAGPGGVIARSYLGLLVPAATGRHTFAGHCLWSEPDCAGRLVAVRDLFTGRLTPSQSRAFVRGSRARFVLADCRPTADLRRILGPLIRSEHDFGCARVFEIEPPPPR
jgi:hypothetical protein